MVRVGAFTGGRNVPSARFRIRQYIPYLRDVGIFVTEHYSPFTAYPPRKKYIRPAWALAAIASQIPSVLASHRYDLCLLQREMLSTLFTLEPLVRSPRLLDVDDAIWLRRNRGSFAKHIAQVCDAVICGNEFLADYFGQWNSCITVLPTPVDTDRFRPLAVKSANGQFIIGWSGSSVDFLLVSQIEQVLSKILKRFPNVRLRIVSDRPPRGWALPEDSVEFITWSPEVEVAAIQGMDIGIMPLGDDLYNQGKCSYKMLLYMACGVPVVVSPIGMNNDVLKLGQVGFGAHGIQDWLDAFEFLLSHRDEATEMGRLGRQVVLKHFSLDILAPQLASQLLQHAN